MTTTHALNATAIARRALAGWVLASLLAVGALSAFGGRVAARPTIGARGRFVACVDAGELALPASRRDLRACRTGL